ncbi:YgjV family protein [Azospirillum sp.]|uniref:YgjV family protein n=1 Tax=Azospirillum sp. TaxID=34012 RepID=UPI002D672094|nr:YgjV family protein [Azospirillum sp.]HYD70188.1 YgjV family protein [Azospirillum sp.]
MVFLLNHLPALTVVTLTGAVGLLFGTASTLLRDRRAILGAQAAGCLAFALHYHALGAYTGTLMCVLGLVQMATALPAERPRWAGALFLATVAGGFAVAAATWLGVMSAFSAVGFALASLGRWQTDRDAMRRCFLAGTLSGAGHNGLAGSAFGLCADALALSGLLWSLRRDQGAAPAPARTRASARA